MYLQLILEDLIMDLVTLLQDYIINEIIFVFVCCLVALVKTNCFVPIRYVTICWFYVFLFLQCATELILSMARVYSHFARHMYMHRIFEFWRHHIIFSFLYWFSSDQAHMRSFLQMLPMPRHLSTIFHRPACKCKYL